MFEWTANVDWRDVIWITVGFAGQGLFTARMLLQWAASEKRRESVVPVAFWWLSLVGGAILLCYAVHQRDPVFFAGQSTGVVVYARNLMIIHGKQGRPDPAPTPPDRVPPAMSRERRVARGRA